jgi:OmpA-OmpF porin, OOP family
MSGPAARPGGEERISMNPTRRLAVCLGAVACLALASAGTGCVSASRIRADAEVVKKDITKARESGAYKCAPRELAMAESHVVFTMDELSQGNWLEADRHNQIAIKNIKKALKKSKGCAPKKVLIKQQQVVEIKKTDTDGDGIVDIEDKCPEVPGLPEYQGCPPPLPQDSDNDGLLDPVDKCPNDPEDKDGFEDEDGCPDFDNDQDGVPDLEDKCPNEPGPPENQGCPNPDRDGDGILNDVDKCPDDPEDKDGFQDEDGCPDTDNDQDGILDPEDKCPNEAGPPDSPQGKGCPRKYSLVQINREKKRIEIKQKVLFETAKYRILPASFKLLNDVSQVLKDYPDMRVSVEGHTDSQGGDEYNQTLSENRANSVREYLAGQGIAPERLRSVGYGESKPIASNRTARGREANRRVEFRIMDEGEQ